MYCATVPPHRERADFIFRLSRLPNSCFLLIEARATCSRTWHGGQYSSAILMVPSRHLVAAGKHQTTLIQTEISRKFHSISKTQSHSYSKENSTLYPKQKFTGAGPRLSSFGLYTITTIVNRGRGKKCPARGLKQ